MSRADPSKPRLLDFKSGGWVLLLAIVLSSTAVAWRLIDMARSGGAQAVGDGRNVATYGFDLSTCLVPRETLVASGLPKDGLRALNLPAFFRPEQVDSIAKRTHRKYLVSNDRVIGVTIGGKSRAYPVRVLNWHEVVNDTLGGRPIAVTYSPLCDAVVVFDREVGGETLRFGVSGLLSNSNLVMYDDRATNAEESLWSQLEAGAIAGPQARWVPESTRPSALHAEVPEGRRSDTSASVALDGPPGRRLTILPASLVHWADWRKRHPETTVLAGDPVLQDEYRRNPYGSYFAGDRLRFPVFPPPKAADQAPKTPMIIVEGGAGLEGFMISSIAAEVDAQGVWRVEVGGRPILFRYQDDPPCVSAEAANGGPQPAVLYAFWFAWNAAQHHSGVRAL
jgi:hypothetical protein